jgi:hypothetical protein
MQPTANPRARVTASRCGEIPWASQRIAVRFAATGIKRIVLSMPYFFPSNLSTRKSYFGFAGMKL